MKKYEKTWAVTEKHFFKDNPVLFFLSRDGEHNILLFNTRQEAQKWAGYRRLCHPAVARHRGEYRKPVFGVVRFGSNTFWRAYHRTACVWPKWAVLESRQ